MWNGLGSGILTISDALCFRIGWGRVGVKMAEAWELGLEGNRLMVGAGRKVVNRHHH